MKLLTFALLIPSCWATIAGPTFNITSGVANGSQTTTAQNSVGSTLLIVNMSGSGGTSLTGVTIDDQCSGVSTSNNWTYLTQQSTATITEVIAYSWDSGSSAALETCAVHTVTVTYATALTISFTGWTGTMTTANPYDSQQNGAQNGSTNTLGTGNVTPSIDGCLIFSAAGLRSQVTPSYTTTLTSIHTVSWVSGMISGLGSAYQIQTTATTVADTWTMTAGSGQIAVAIAVFKPAPTTINGPTFNTTSNASSGSQTTGTVNSTTSTLLVVDMTGSGGTSLTGIDIDDKCSGVSTTNNWHYATEQLSTTVTKVIAYAYDSGSSAPLTTCASHAVTTTYATVLTVSFTGWSGTSLTPFDQENGANTAGGTASFLGTGSITPSVANCLIISSGGLRSQATPYTTLLTQIHSVSWVTGTVGGLSTSYRIQTTAMAVSDTWTMGGSGELAVAIISFKPQTATKVRHRVSQ